MNKTLSSATRRRTCGPHTTECLNLTSLMWQGYHHPSYLTQNGSTTTVCLGAVLPLFGCLLASSDTGSVFEAVFRSVGVKTKAPVLTNPSGPGKCAFHLVQLTQPHHVVISFGRASTHTHAHRHTHLEGTVLRDCTFLKIGKGLASDREEWRKNSRGAQNQRPEFGGPILELRRYP